MTKRLKARDFFDSAPSGRTLKIGRHSHQSLDLLHAFKEI